MVIKRKHRSWIITSAIAAVSLGYTFLLFLPGQRSIDELRSKLRNRQEFISQAQGLNLAIQAAEEEAEHADEFSRAWESNAPDDEQLARLFARMTRLAREAGTTALRFEPQEVVPMHSLKRVPVRLGAQGTFQQIFGMLEGLESLPQTIWVKEMRLHATGENGGPLRCELNLEVFTVNRAISG